jgi:hypothetical protein
MGKYYALLKYPNVFVKEGDFFEGQGGLTEEWGQSWIRIEADDLGHARNKAASIRDNMENIDEDLV